MQFVVRQWVELKQELELEENNNKKVRPSINVFENTSCCYINLDRGHY